MSEADKLKNKLEQAEASAQRPVRVTDAEFAVIMLRESFVAAQASFLYVAVILADDATPALTRRCSLSCPPRLPRCSRRRLPRRPPQRAQIPSGSSA